MNQLTIIIVPSKKSVLGSPIDIGDVEDALEEEKKIDIQKFNRFFIN